MKVAVVMMFYIGSDAYFERDASIIRSFANIRLCTMLLRHSKIIFLSDMKLMFRKPVLVRNTQFELTMQFSFGKL
ncbi:hypothetical protein OB236_19220 [Paenibacillus sp. WQ 127069]|uniref:Uncharacterized protein n=1 Tax=Paenibacillus baimaensis TaxID=2982185 RepID=A0ABT2UJE1_9BACL|nr:hypothetical protein [Paenibacillus sp. WQ 127069]